MIKEESKEYDVLMQKLNKVYSFKEYNEKLNKDIYENVKPILDNHAIDGDVIIKFIPQYVIDNISERQKILLFKQPIVLVLYYLIQKHSREFREMWNFPFEMLDMIYWDLGISDEY